MTLLHFCIIWEGAGGSNVLWVRQNSVLKYVLTKIFLLKTNKDIKLIGIFTCCINWEGDDMGGDRYLI